MKSDKDFLIPSNVFTKDTSGIYLKNKLISNPFSFERALEEDFMVAKVLNAGDEKTELTEDIFIASNILCVRVKKAIHHKHQTNQTHEGFIKVVENYNAIIAYTPLEKENTFVSHFFLPLGYTVTDLEEYNRLRTKAEAAFRSSCSGFFKPSISCPVGVRHDFSDAAISYNLSLPSVMKLWLPKLKHDPLHGMIHGVDAEKILKNAKKGKKRRLMSRSTLEEFNSIYAVAPIGGKTCILKEELTDKGIVTHFTTKRDIIDWYANKYPDSAGSVKEWMSHPDRRTYDKIDFRPGEKLPKGSYNLWRGFQYVNQPGDRSCDLYLQHIAKNIANGDPVIEKYILDWMAILIQNPCSRPGVAIGLRGSQGTGKSVFVTIFGALFGEHFVHATSADHLTGKYNAHLQKNMLLFSDEAVNSKYKAGEAALKTLISEKTRLIESKGKDVVTVENFTWLILASNEANIVPATLGDRRFFIVDVGEGRKKDTEFFKQMYDDMNNGGYRALLEFLMNRDVSGVELTKIPETEAKKDIQLSNMEASEHWWFKKLERGLVFQDDDEWLDRVLTTRLYEDFQKSTKSDMIINLFGKKLAKMLPGVIARQHNTDLGKKAYFYILPALEECRQSFEKYARIEVKWQN